MAAAKRAANIQPVSDQSSGPDYSSNGPDADPLTLMVPGACAGLRADQALARLLPELSRSRLQAWMRRGRVTRNGAPVSPRDKVWNGDWLQVDREPDPEVLGTLPEDIPLNVVFEDDAILVVNKPAGLVVHPGSGNPRGTLQNAVLRHAPESAGVPRSGIVHRLDKDTSGLLVVAKTLAAQVAIVRQLQARSVRREYLAVVHGDVTQAGDVEAPIGRHPISRTRMAVVAAGKPARTHYRVVERLPGVTLLRLALETGRTHQIRVHMQSIGHPLVGDPVYGRGAVPASCPPEARAFSRQALHAETLGLVHPASGVPMRWTAPLPPDMEALIAALRAHRHQGVSDARHRGS
jgi:23S rRNA pseudouridine1911/1915/1917 synthase